MNKFEEDVAKILDYTGWCRPNPVETLMNRSAVDIPSDAKEGDKLLKLLLKQLREALMDLAIDEDALAEEAKMMVLPIPDEGFHNKATELVLHLISRLKKMGADEEVRQTLDGYKKDHFFR